MAGRRGREGGIDCTFPSSPSLPSSLFFQIGCMVTWSTGAQSGTWTFPRDKSDRKKKSWNLPLSLSEDWLQRCRQERWRRREPRKGQTDNMVRRDRQREEEVWATWQEVMIERNRLREGVCKRKTEKAICVGLHHSSFFQSCDLLMVSQLWLLWDKKQETAKP